MKFPQGKGVKNWSLAKIRGRDPEYQKYNTSLVRVCEVGSKLNNKHCDGLAYRRVNSRFGDKYTCDKCARALANENDPGGEV